MTAELGLSLAGVEVLSLEEQLDRTRAAWPLWSTAATSLKPRDASAQVAKRARWRSSG
jgi:hypothetical protein